jgi:hypothetical protein
MNKSLYLSLMFSLMIILGVQFISEIIDGSKDHMIPSRSERSERTERGENLSISDQSAMVSEGNISYSGVCDDGNVCTIDLYLGASRCLHIPMSGISCNDNNKCTISDRCLRGSCVGTPKNCSDGNSCTDDICDSNTGQCINTPKNCDDNVPCTIDSCDPTTGQCSHATKNCDDNDPCTDDSCDPETGQCLHTPKNCDDGKPCTLDSCDSETGQCIYTHQKIVMTVNLAP